LALAVLAIVGALDAMLDSRMTKHRLEQLGPRVKVRWLPEVGHVILDQTPFVVEFLRGDPYGRSAAGAITSVAS
jgi:hypothetical protein